jgi:hypothetical protein
LRWDLHTIGVNIWFLFLIINLYGEIPQSQLVIS